MNNRFSKQIPVSEQGKYQKWDDYEFGRPFPKNMIPVATNGSGDLLVRNSKDNKLYEYNHEKATKENPFVTHHTFQQKTASSVENESFEKIAKTRYMKWLEEGGKGNPLERKKMIDNLVIKSGGNPSRLPADYERFMSYRGAIGPSREARRAIKREVGKPYTPATSERVLAAKKQLNLNKLREKKKRDAAKEFSIAAKNSSIAAEKLRLEKVMKNKKMALAGAGIGAGTLALGAGAYGAKKIYDKKKQEKTAFNVVNDSFEKMAAIGAGVNVWDSESGKFGVSLGIPYGVSLDYKFGNGYIRPKVGFGLTGPHLGLSVGNKNKKNKDTENNKDIDSDVNHYLNSSDYKEHTPEERKSMIDDIKAGKLTKDHSNADNWTDKDRKEYEDHLRSKGHGKEIDALRSAFPKQAFNIVNECFEKIANTMEFKSGNFKATNETQSTKGFRSGNFEKTKIENTETKRPVIINNASNASNNRSIDGISSQAKKQESKSEIDVYKNVRTSVLSVSNTPWYQSLPESLRRHTDNELEHQAWQLVSEGLSPTAASMVMKSNMKSAINDDVLAKYKYIDKIESKIRNSDDYTNEYNNGTGRKKGPKWGAGIGAGVGTGIGALIGHNVTGALVGAGMGAGLGALTGYTTGVSSDMNNAFGVAQKKIAPDYNRLNKDAYKELSSRMS